MIERKDRVLMLYKIITNCSHAQRKALARGVGGKASGLIRNCKLSRITLTLKRTRFFYITVRLFNERDTNLSRSTGFVFTIALMPLLSEITRYRESNKSIVPTIGFTHNVKSKQEIKCS